MIEHIRIVRSESREVFYNQGLESLLFERAAEGEATLYLWANRDTVVVGRNQDAFAECDVKRLEADGGTLARRLSGGGAVFHDEGNLNFTFIAREPDFSTDTNRSVVLSALGSLGIDAVLTGRNDIEVAGCKISGNAYYGRGGAHMHHGTLLVCSSAEKVARYLTPPYTKFAGKRVASVAGRVSSLDAFRPGIKPSDAAEALCARFIAAYPDAGLSEIAPADLGCERLDELTAFYADDEWRYGKCAEWDMRAAAKLFGSGATVKLRFDGARIAACEIDTDGLYPEKIAALEKLAAGVTPPVKGEALKTLLGEWAREGLI